MVAIGLRVNWSVLDVCSVSKCESLFVVCVWGAVRYLHRHTWLLPCGQERQACDQGRRGTQTGPEGREVS